MIDLSNGIRSVNSLNLSDFASSIRYVKLNSSDENLLAVFNQIIYEDGLFMISDNQEKYVYTFNEDGSFKQKIGQIGQGPGEYNKLKWFDYLPGHDEILIHPYSRDTYFYNPEGNFIRKFNFSKFYETDTTVIESPFRVIYVNPTVFAIDINFVGTPLSKLMLVKDSLQVILDVPANSSFEFDWGEMGAILGHGLQVPETNVVMYRRGDKIIHYNPYQDTIHVIDKNLKMEYIPINFGNYKNDSYSKEKVISLLNMEEFSDFFFFEFRASGLTPEPYESYSNGMTITLSNICAVYNKKTSELTFLKQAQKGKLGFKNDIDDGLPFWPKYINAHGEMVSYYQPDEFMEAFQNKEDVPDDVKAILKDLQNDDNPIVVIAKIKQ
ncbi:hypothetical protein FACS189420_0110 [Bacteroidia bacterium]|nr:hypothetical protein FACS18947_0050 [Bacteroidia bacterium]GHV70163.1 hypothetical protein FACS189420_0110 [Bacteroidia bacterium]